MADFLLFPFHERLKLAKMFEVWAKENGVKDCAESVIAYLCINKLLSYKKVREFMNGAEKKE